jgi:hypothetical protein
MWGTLTALGYTWKHIEGDEEGVAHFLVTPAPSGSTGTSSQ